MTELIAEKTFEAILRDDAVSFGALMEKDRIGAYRYGRFPVLSLMYLFKSKKLIKRYEEEFIKITSFTEKNEPVTAFSEFKKIAGKCLRLYFSEIVSPLEMLLISDDIRRLKRIYPLADDEITLSEIEALRPEGIILSPGPGKPSEAAASLRILDKFKGKIPILGVCLGHQAIGYYFGASVKKGSLPMHGKVTEITHCKTGMFAGLPQAFRVTRYHSLVVEREGLPSFLSVDASAGEGVIMGISHKSLPVYGVQFHPEAVLTEYGKELLDNFIKICVKWRGAAGL